MRAMHPKSPAERRWGMHRANILPPRGAFAVRSPQIMHGARILPPSGGPAPEHGLLPEQLHRGIAFQRLGPCPGVPAPAPRRYPPPANACRLPCPLQPEASRRRASAAVIRRMACSSAKPRGTADYIISTGGPISECCAEPGLDSRTVSKWAQNRRRRPQARPGLRQRCRKRPSKGRVPLGGTIGTPQKIATKVAFLGCPWPSLRQSQFHQPSRSCARSSRSINATQDFSGCHLTSSRQSFSRLCRSVSQHRCRVGLSWAALAQFAPGPFEIYWSCLGS